MNWSYDYTELLHEIKEDLADGLLEENSMLKVVRSDKVVYENYRAIIDYYFPDDTDIREGDVVELMEVRTVLAEMEFHDQLVKNMPEKVITSQEAAKLLGISERGVRWNCESGKYMCRKAGKVWLIDRRSLGLS